MGDFPTRIPLATDGSEGADLAASRAVELARRTDSELHVAHVGCAPAFLMGRARDARLRPHAPRGDRRRGAGAAPEAGLAGEGSRRDVAGAHLRMGEADLGIVGLAKRLGADLIVMGCRGRRGIRRAVGRSVSDAVIRLAPCPVLVVPSGEMAEPPEHAALLQGGR